MRKFLIVTLVLALVLGLSGLALGENRVYVSQRGDCLNKAYNWQHGGANNHAFQEQIGTYNRLGTCQETSGSANHSELLQDGADNQASVVQIGSTNESLAEQRHTVAGPDNRFFLYQKSTGSQNLSTLEQYDSADSYDNLAFIAQITPGQFNEGFFSPYSWKWPEYYMP